MKKNGFLPRLGWLAIVGLLFLGQGCDPEPSHLAVLTSLAPAAAPTATLNREAPDELFGELFRRVQMERVFADGKTFVDMVPKAEPSEIMAAYTAAKDLPGFNLKAFVDQYFAPPAQPESGYASDSTRDIVGHINALWPYLTRRAGADEGAAGSLIPLPNDYVVPGGRFREVYYWDSYFTLLGLQTAGRNELVRDMVENFAFLIDEVGHVPNGNRTYYLTRSQPPFFALMVEVLADIEGEKVYAEFMPQLLAEHQYWMQGAADLTPNQRASNHSVLLGDGSILNRYYDAGDRPRAESYREDVLTIRDSGRDSQLVARHLRSGAESGWDYSARWFADGENIASIVTTDILPPDLTSLLWKLEQTISEHHPDETTATKYTRLANKRAAAIDKFLWNPLSRYYEDYNWTTGQHTGYLTLAGTYPFFVGLAPTEYVETVGNRLSKDFLGPGGLRTSLQRTGQQWDAPNGWPPLQWMAYKGMLDYGRIALASEIKNRWMKNNQRVYANVQKMVEKYNVEDISLLAGGGEYPVQDGFGWSNGVYLRMTAE